jgi:hypothetical protein
MQRSINIISGQIPCPNTPGDAQQTYWIIGGLCAAGIDVHLYTFKEEAASTEATMDGTIDPTTDPKLLEICASITSYPVNKGHRNFSFSVPYAAAQYQNGQLVNDLAKNNFPILIEGMGPCSLALSKKLTNKKIWVRLLTFAPGYFGYLQERSKAPLKKLYYQREAVLSKKLLKKINQRVQWIVPSVSDKTTLENVFLGGNISTLALFNNNNTITSKTGLGNYCLFQGNLADAATHKTAVWLLTHVFHNLTVPFVITGNNPAPALIELAHKQPHTCIVANPSAPERIDMIEKAQIILQPSFIKHGPDEALLEGIKMGRHCITNSKTTGSPYAPCYHQGSSASAFQEIIIQLYHFPFSEEEIETRKKIIATEKSNTALTSEFANIIWG